jgi:HEPN domain-containing protein
MKATPPLVADAAFLCQQAAEKVLKAFLAWHDVPFRRTHDLTELGETCVKIDGSLQEPARSAGPLTEYA